jgi:DNA-binding PadR family transcriptional regulator
MAEGHLTPAMFYILLSLVDRDRHGLGIVHDVEERTGGRIKIGPALLYTSLRRLEERALAEISPTRPAQREDDPRRKYYRITRRGRRAVREEAELLDTVLAIARDRNVLPKESGR